MAGANKKKELKMVFNFYESLLDATTFEALEGEWDGYMVLNVG